MSQYISTRPASDRSTKMITIDSKNTFYSKPANTESKFEVDLDFPLHIPNSSVVYLESVYIGGFKISEAKRLLFPSGNPSNPANLKDDIVTHFNFSIPELGIVTYAGDTGNRQSPFNGCFTLPNEKIVRQATAGTLVASDFQPYFLGHLSRTAVYISRLQPKTLSRISVNVTDQNGESIFKDLEGTHADLNSHGAGNPPIASRRIVMQFIIAEDS
tara:strand:+ start:1239 stop:1883 length:645 start_codon:yes stop_codon:yes gene_type:complete